MFCLLRRFFASLTDYEFLSSVSSIDFYRKRIYMKPYFWKGTMVLFVKYFDHQTDNKKRQLAYIIKQVMLERLTFVSDSAMRGFFEQQIHVSCVRYKSKLKKFINNKPNNKSNNQRNDDLVSNSDDCEQEQLAILQQLEDEESSDDVCSILGNPPEEESSDEDSDVQSEPPSENSEATESFDNSQQGTSTQWIDQANRLADNVVESQLIVESLPTIQYYSSTVVRNIISEVEQMENPPPVYRDIATAVGNLDNSISTYQNFLSQSIDPIVTYREGSPLGDEFFENQENYNTYDDSRLEIYSDNDT
jgi:hypothetical protein